MGYTTRFYCCTYLSAISDDAWADTEVLGCRMHDIYVLQFVLAGEVGENVAATPQLHTIKIKIHNPQSTSFGDFRPTSVFLR